MPRQFRGPVDVLLGLTAGERFEGINSNKKAKVPSVTMRAYQYAYGNLTQREKTGSMTVLCKRVRALMKEWAEECGERTPEGDLHRPQCATVINFIKGYSNIYWNSKRKRYELRSAGNAVTRASTVPETSRATLPETSEEITVSGDWKEVWKIALEDGKGLYGIGEKTVKALVEANDERSFDTSSGARLCAELKRRKPAPKNRLNILLEYLDGTRKLQKD